MALSFLCALMGMGLFAATAMGAADPPSAGWVHATAPHLEIYAHTDSATAIRLLRSFQQLDFYFRQNHFVSLASAETRRPVRIIAFASPEEYRSFTIRAVADAYFLGNGDRNYIVMPVPRIGSFSVPTHEYAHLVLHSAGLRLPAWLDEGVAEVFSTLVISPDRCYVGGPVPVHVATLRRSSWLALPAIASESETKTVLRATREQAAVFYAESWALADTLMFDPAFTSRFPDLLQALQPDGANFESSFESVYRVSPRLLLDTARARLAKETYVRSACLSQDKALPLGTITAITPWQAGSVLADLAFADGHLTEAKRRYQELLRQAPDDGPTLAALGSLESAEGNTDNALADWKRATDAGVTDPALLYRYALLLDSEGSAPEELKRVLERVVALDPSFADARWRLALLLNNRGEFAQALEQLRASGEPDKTRAYAYWFATAYALTQLNRHDEGQRAAEQAARLARTAEERNRASDLAYVAQTDMAVRFTRGSNGELQLTTTRVLRGSTNFNPFVEPGDRMVTVAGALREVTCANGHLTGVVVQADGTVVTLSVADPQHVLIRGGRTQMQCGVQSESAAITVEYAQGPRPNTGILRAMLLR